jgi:hypothetical protein
MDGLKEFLDSLRRESGTEINAIKTKRDGDVPIVVVDQNRRVEDASALVAAFEKTQATPYRRRGIYKAADIKSLLDWMSAHCDKDAPVFGEGAENLAKDWKAPKLAIVGIGNYSNTTSPAWHDFGVRYDFPVTLAWTKWVARNGEVMDQAKFAEFVEEHLYEFSEPLRGENIGEACTRMIEALGGSKHVGSPSKMYEMARGVALTVSEKVQVSLDRSTGEAALQFSEEHTGKGGRPVAIPKFFYIRVPIFFGAEPALVGALLRYRNAGGGSVVWSYELFAPDLVVKAAFDKVCDIVRNAHRTLYLGTADKPV